jgi:preprotein translocase subunit SecD
VTLTLAGIAAFILSIGMAVDANILIFERMREELRWGRSVHAALRAGFDRAWTSIRDSNSSTLITCLLLYWFGQNFGASLITGFALTLAVGVVVSLFSAIFVTRGLLVAVMSSPLAHNPMLFGMSVPDDVNPPVRPTPGARLRAEGGVRS